jgi:nicotinate-nucleotide adenylyltransferase
MLMRSDIGIIGGTFNPIHIGHLRLAEDVREEFGLERILFIPTNLPPHKSMDGMIDSEDRLEMVRLALRDNEHLACDDAEIRRGGVSYTIDTARYLYGKRGLEGPLHLIIGSDLLLDLAAWKRIDDLVRLVDFIVLVRPDFPVADREKPPVPGARLRFFDNRKIDVTSSEIRERIKENRSIRYLVPESVYRYIYENDLYRPR